MAGKRIGFGSYGSGASAMVFSGVIQPEYKAVVKEMNIETEIGTREKLSFENYEMIHENKLSLDQALLTPKKEFVLVGIETKPETRGERRYIFNE